MNDFSFSVPQNIMVGRGSLAKLPEAAKQLGGSHAFIISGPHLTKMGLVGKVSDSLKAAGFAVDAFTETEGNPSTDTVEKAAAGLQGVGRGFYRGLRRRLADGCCKGGRRCRQIRRQDRGI